MILSEMVMMFLDSRKRGTMGAKKKASASTMEIYRRNLKEFTNFLSEFEEPVVNYTQLKRRHLIAFYDHLDKKAESGEWHMTAGLCPSKLQVLRTLKTFFRWVDADEDCKDAELHGMQKYLPAIPKNPRRQDIPEVRTLKVFKNAFNTDTKNGLRNYIVTSLLMDTGLRAGEVASLRVDGVLLNDRALLVIGKTGPRAVPVSSEMARMMKAWLKKRASYKTARESPYVFPAKYGPQMTAEAIRKMYAKHRAKHGFGRITAHTFRHAFVTNWLSRGGDIDKLKNITGHSTYEMLEGYLQRSNTVTDAMRTAVDKISMLREED